MTSGALDALALDRERRGEPIRVALVGAGVTGRSIALQLLTPPPGLRLVAVANRTLERAVQAFRDAGTEPVVVTDAGGLDRAARAGNPAVTADWRAVTGAECVDVIVEVTGTQEHAAGVVVAAIEAGKHVVLVNAELDSTLGPLLAARAREAGVVLTNTDGDEPGVAMTLLRYLKSLGLRPVAAGNLKGMVDYHRNPDTQRRFAEEHGQDVRKVTSFADATKLSMEATILANATGFRVGRRGMYGPACSHVSELPALLPAEDLLGGGLVDYALGAAPHTGAFVIVHEPDPAKQRHLAYYKLGTGPYYVFYTPFHLPHVQIASTILRAALHQDATVAAAGAPVCETIAMAKVPLRAGTVLDGVGGYTCYGLIENFAAARGIDALPMGLSEGCRLRRDLEADEPIALADVERPAGRLIDRLWEEQGRRFAPRDRRATVEGGTR